MYINYILFHFYYLIIMTCDMELPPHGTIVRYNSLFPFCMIKNVAIWSLIKDDWQIKEHIKSLFKNNNMGHFAFIL